MLFIQLRIFLLLIFCVLTRILIMGFYFADIYVCCMSKTNCVAPKNKFLAIVSTTVETSNPEAELKPGLDLLGKIDEKFIAVSDIYEPTNDGKENKVCFLKETQHS